MRRRFRARPLQVHVLAHDQLKSSDQRSFHRRDIHFAVALARMAITGEKQSSFRMHRNEQRRASYQFFVIQIARVNPRRRA